VGTPHCDARGDRLSQVRATRRRHDLDDLPQPPSDPLGQSEARAQLARAFHALPAPLRAAATLALVEELPYSEIAQALDISLSAVEMRVSRAIRLLRANLEKKGLRP
jgi:RNA polymerase sigma factor (sigma-70 family)